MENNSEMPVVMFTNYKRPDGFEVSLTLRGTDVKIVASELNEAILGIVKAGGTPVSRQARGYPPKVIEYVPDRVCPTCGEKLVYANKKDGSKFIKCSTNKYINGQASGCAFVEWPKMTNADL